MNKTFRHYDQSQQFLIPPSLDEWLPENHLARFVSDLVEDVLDLGPFLASYKEVRGFPPYDPRLMLKLLLYGYVTGTRSSRAIERECADSVAFRWLAANATPDYRSIARFRRRHLPALRELFRTSLSCCQGAGMVSLGRVALDGTKVRASASRRKAMSYRYLTEKELILAAEVDDMLHDAEVTDAREDKTFGKDRRGDELPKELLRREGRLAVMRKAKADLEERARTEAADKARKRATDKGLEEDVIEECAAQASAVAEPKPTAQASFTDPDARIMKTADGSFQYCFNAQAVVDEAHQVIVATTLSNRSADCPELPPLLDQVRENTGATPKTLLADAGYFSTDNVEAATVRGIDPLIATGRLRHGEETPPAPRGRTPKNLTPKQLMARKLRTKPGRADYKRRKAIVEPVFGQIGTCHGGKAVLLRGIEAAEAEWHLLAASHNFRKLYGFGGIPALGAI
ncbi:MAG: IS1182 family transposase [Acidimicrobiales bacterium]